MAAFRYENWKISFLQQSAVGMEFWQKPFEPLRAPAATNLRMDPFELAQTIGWVTNAGILSTCSSLLRLRPISADGYKVSRIFHRASGPAASILTV